MGLNILSTVIRAIGLSALIFWSIILTHSFSLNILMFILPSLIPISICCILTIWGTIAPFFISRKRIENLETIYRKYFPFYSITIFGLCFFAILTSKFDVYALAFFTSAFFTALQSWNWIVKFNKKPTT